MDDIIKYLVSFDDEQPYELLVENEEEAEKELKRNYSAYGEVKLLKVIYRPVSITPRIINTK